MNRLKFTLKAWPVIAIATIGLCFLTQGIATLFGKELPDQQNVELMRMWLCRAFESPKAFANCVILLAQVLVIMPAVEELIFRWLFFQLPARKLAIRNLNLLIAIVAISSALFSAAHYIAQPFPDAAFIALFFFGIAQCWLYRKTDRIWCPMLNHALFNITNLVLLFVVPE